MKTVTKILPVIAVLSLVGCSNMSSTEQRVLSGAAIGAVGGAAIGAIAGGHGAGAGALIGAGVGAVGGLIYDRSVKDDRDYDDRY
jgi:uncharacterized membrane protein